MKFFTHTSIVGMSEFIKPIPEKPNLENLRKRAKKLLNERKGHTELVISMMKIAGLPPVGSGCEIMGDDGRALPKEKAMQYAKKHNLVFLEGKEIVKAWKKWSK